MSKVIVPQELQEQIINLYVNKQYGLLKIKKELNLNFNLTVIKKILQEHKIHIRNFTEAKIGYYKIEVPQELQLQIIDMYQRGYGLERIVKELQLTFSFDKVRTILQDNGIHIRNVQESAQVKIMPDLRKYKVNDNYNFENHNGAWILGFIAADGYLPITKGAKNKIVISLQEKDRNVLELIAQELEYNGLINTYITNLNDKQYPFCSLSITSKMLREKIERYGITNAKTFKLQFPYQLPNEYKIDYIRGFFDGDGSIYKKANNRKDFNMSFCCARKQFLKDIMYYLNSDYNLSIPTINIDKRHNHDNYYIRYYLRDSLILGKLFYENNYLALPRKKQKYFELIKTISPTSLNTPKE